MTKSAENSEHKRSCVARRHLPASLFVTYDAMIAVVTSAANQLKKEGKWKEGDPLPPFFLSAMGLGNLNDRNESVERDNLKQLVKLGWIVLLNPKRRRFHGRWDENHYRVLTHDAFVKSHLDDPCPAERYPMVPGAHKRVSATPNRPPAAIERKKVRDRLRANGLNWQASPLGDQLLDALVDQQWERTHTTIAEIPATVETADAEDPAQVIATSAKTPATYSAETPALDQRGNSRDTACTNKREAQEGDNTSQPTSVQTNPVGGRQAGGTSSKSSLEEATMIAEQEKYEQYRGKNWKQFIDGSKEIEAFRAAFMSREETEQVRKQVDRYGAETVLEALEEWAEERTPPINGRDFGRWTCWLNEGGDFLNEAVQNANEKRVKENWQADQNRLRGFLEITQIALKENRSFINTEWSYGEQDRQLVIQAKEPYLSIDRIKKLRMPLSDLLTRLNVWNVVCNGAPLPPNENPEEWPDWVNDVREVMAKTKAACPESERNEGSKNNS